MTGGEVMEIGQEAIWTALKAAGPVMAVGLIVGLVVALFQALTQIQEMTLAFIPKIVAIFVTLLIAMPFIGATLGAFAQDLFARIAAM